MRVTSPLHDCIVEFDVTLRTNKYGLNHLQTHVSYIFEEEDSQLHKSAVYSAILALLEMYLLKKVPKIVQLKV